MDPLWVYNKKRIEFIIKNVKRLKESMEGQILKDLDVLDIGCGGGYLTESLANLGANVTGIDSCKASID